VVVSAKTAEPIEMLFGFWAQMAVRNHVLDGSPHVLGTLPWQPILGRSLLTGFLAFDGL